MTIIVVPGMEGSSHEWVLDDRRTEGLGTGAVGGSGKLEYWEVGTWSHGWPLEYLRRPYDFHIGPFGIHGTIANWSTRSAWRIWGHAYAFSSLNLVVDLLIAFGIIVGTVSACEIWRRRRGGFRFSLSDAAIVAAILCGVLGWWQYHSRAAAREKQICQGMKDRGSLSGPAGPYRAGASDGYHGPRWLARLAGCPYAISFCVHIDRLDLDTALLKDPDYAELRGLTYVDTVHVTGRLSQALADALAALPALHTLDGLVTSFGGYPGATVPEPLVAGPDIALLRRIPHLRHLTLGECKIDSAGMACLATLPELESLQLDAHESLIEDLEPLTISRTLSSIEFDICATREEWAIFAMKHPTLDIRLPKSLFGDDAPCAAQIQEVAAVLLKRWRKEDRALATEVVENNSDAQDEKSRLDEDDQQEPPSSLGSTRGLFLSGERYYADEPLTEIDFSGIQLTRERLERIPTIVLARIDSVTLGKVDSATTALELVHRCAPLTQLDARHIPLTRRELDTIRLQPGCSLYLQQGTLRVADFCDLLKRWQPQLTIFKSSFSPDEVREIEIAGDGLLFGVYTHLVEEEDQAIDAATLPSDGDNPFAE